MRTALCAGVLLVWPAGAVRAQVCAQAGRPEFYDGYRVAGVRVEAPGRPEQLRTQAGKPFSARDFADDYRTLRELVDAKLSTGSPLALAIVTGTLADCDEAKRSLTVRFHVFRAGTRMDLGSLSLTPVLGYDASRRLFGGGQFTARWHAPVFSSLSVEGSGSPNSGVLRTTLEGSRGPGLAYQAGYFRSDLPARGLTLRERRLYARFTAARGIGRGWSARYGASLEGGHTQSSGAGLPGEVVGAASYGALKFYGGANRSAGRQQVGIAYGFEAAGSGAQLDFSKHLATAQWSTRLPGGTHRPWDVELRAAGGGVAGGGRVHLSERFFGGNVDRPFAAGAGLDLVNGPLVRSIPEFRMTGAGYGGDRFYSVNTTLGKVLWHWPLIPPEVEDTPGFAEALEAGEMSATNFLRLQYKTRSPEFARVMERAEELGKHLKQVQEQCQAIRTAGSLTPAQEQDLAKAERLVKRSLARIGRQPEQIRALAIPAASPVFPLIAALRAVDDWHKGEHLAPVVEGDMAALTEALQAVDTGSADAAARARAEADMRAVRDTIDGMRREVNRIAVGPVAAFDAGRLWPDPGGTRYGLGVGLRVSILNLNLTSGYSWNPRRYTYLREGAGAVFFTLSYVNLFR